jgi:hypothetical protein
VGVWGAQPAPDQQLDAEELAFFDELALFCMNLTRRSTISV